MAFFGKQNSALGIDVTNTSIKIFQLGRKKKGYEVFAYGSHPLHKGIVVNDVIMNPQLLGETIKAAAAKMLYGKLRTRFAVASIPESKAFVRVIQIPKLTEEQADVEVSVEAEQYIPIPLDQAYLDWQILGDAPEDKMNVLVAAAPKDYIDTLIKALKAGGLRPVGIEIGGAAIARALLPPQAKDKDLLIVDVGAYRSSLIVVSKGFLQFTTSVPIAGDAFNQAIARRISASEEQAEKAKVAYGLESASANPEVRAALLPVVDNLVGEINNILKFHADHSSAPISQIYLSGGGVRFPGFAEYLGEKFAAQQAEIIVGNPWINVLASQNPKAQTADWLAFSAAIGLALRGTEIKF